MYGILRATGMVSLMESEGRRDGERWRVRASSAGAMSIYGGGIGGFCGGDGARSDIR